MLHTELRQQALCQHTAKHFRNITTLSNTSYFHSEKQPHGGRFAKLPDWTSPAIHNSCLPIGLGSDIFLQCVFFSCFPFLNVTQPRAIGHVRPTDGAVEPGIKSSLIGCSPYLNFTFNRLCLSLKFEQYSWGVLFLYLFLSKCHSVVMVVWK